MKRKQKKSEWVVPEPAQIRVQKQRNQYCSFCRTKTPPGLNWRAREKYLVTRKRGSRVTLGVSDRASVTWFACGDHAHDLALALSFEMAARRIRLIHKRQLTTAIKLRIRRWRRHR